MALTPEELESQIESLNATISDLNKSGEAVKAEITSRDQKIAELEALAKKSPAADYEDLKLRVAKVDVLQKENVQLKTQLTMGELRTKFPDVDFSLVPNGTREEMEATAGKIQASIVAAVKKHIPPPAPNGAGNTSTKTDPWAALPPANGDLEETRRRQENEKQDQAIESAKKSGDAKSVLDGIVRKHGGFMSAFGLTPAK